MTRLNVCASTDNTVAVHPLRRLGVFMLSGLLAIPGFAVDVANAPLSVASGVPGNVVLTPSVEFPTAIGMANIGNFVAGTRYLGYFDPSKCYRYQLRSPAPAADNDTVHTGNNISYFYPVSATNSTFKCVAAGFTDTWSGSFMNWMIMQSIDPFRWALTGGNRRVDTSTLTVLERAWAPNGGGAGQGADSNFPPIPSAGRASPSSTDIADHTPMSFTAIKVSVRARGNEFLISNGSGGSPPTLTTASPAPAIPNPGTHQATTTFATSVVYRFYARVKVCDSAISGLGLAGLESNCVQYSAGYKPEGLLHEYSEKMRFSVFGYPNDPTDNRRDAGVLRARQKFVGPYNIVAGSAPTINTNKEWDAVTGVLVTNPDPIDASNTASHWGVAVPNSGIINYINKFGQEYRTYKRRDPVSELYYAALRYLKNQGNVTEWMPGAAEADKARLIDGFPIVQTWNDPIQYSCQKNFILGIGDTNTNWDRNLPGTTVDGAPSPAKPAAVAADSTVNAGTMTNKVGVLQGMGTTLSASVISQGSYLMAGLAYHAATQDIRPDLANLPSQPRGQNVQTFWLDVLENGAYATNNPYYLAAKYGGLRIPDDADFNPVTATSADILSSYWWTSGETVGSPAQNRPDNFYTVSNPATMINGLKRAFSRIAATGSGSASSLAANSTRLETDTMTFQATFNAGSWNGDLKAFNVDEDDGSITTNAWRAALKLDGTVWTTRNIKVNAGGSLLPFLYANLTPSQKSAIDSDATQATKIVNYLRGERANESVAINPLRVRSSVLGDIVNSTPVFVGRPNAKLHASASFTGASSYAGFATGAAASRTQVIYVGANDGMLHSFNASNNSTTGGTEVFAFVPSQSIANGLASYSKPEYVHNYFVDGEIAVSDIYDVASSSWKTVLVGSMGRGGPGVFALDVTNPSAPTLMWEKNGSDIPGLGKNIGRPMIAQVANGDWRVLIGNGPGSSGGRARMIVITLGGASSGTVSVVTPPETSTDNGLSAVLARDSNADGFADSAYAGDLQGNLWKFSGLAAGASSALVFAARDAGNDIQPITAAPMVGKDNSTGQTWIFVGTGQYLNDTDLSNEAEQTWYGLKDTGSTIAGRGSLVERDIVAEPTLAGRTVRVIEEGAASELASSDGWYIDLVSPVVGAEGERMVVPNRFQGKALIGTSRVPLSGDACSPSGKGFVMAINPFSGARLDATFFDASNDGLFNESDMVCTSGTCVPVSGLGFASSPNNPISVENYLYVGLDNGATETIKTQGSSVQAERLTWRELFQ